MVLRWAGVCVLLLVSACGDDALAPDLAMVSDDLAVASDDLATPADLAVQVPVAGVASGTVSEQAIGGADGGLGPGDGGTVSDVVSGTLSLDFGGSGPATMKAFQWSTSVPTARDPETNVLVPLTSAGSAISWTTDDDGRVLIGAVASGLNAGRTIARAALTDLGTGTFRFQLLGPIDHPDVDEVGGADALVVTFGYTIETTLDLSASGNLAITILDDGPSMGPNLVYPIAATTGNLFDQTRGGADRLRVHSWVFNATTWFYDGTVITSIPAGSSHSWDAATKTWSSQHPTGTYLSLKLETGDFVFSPIGLVFSMQIQPVLADRDGDTVAGTLTFNP